jgi:hypothetical protein
MPSDLSDDNATYPPTVAVPAAGEPRTSLSVRTPFQTLANRTANLKLVIENLLNGVTTAPNLKTDDLDAAAATVAALNAIDAALGDCSIGNLGVDDAAEFHGDATFDTGAVAFTDGFSANGPVNVNSVVTLAGGGNLSGAGAVSAKLTCTAGNRIVWTPIDGIDSNGTNQLFNVNDGDYIFAPYQSANVIWRIGLTGAAQGCRIKITTLRGGVPQITDPAKVITLQNSDVTPIGVILGGTSGSVEWVELVFMTATKWEIFSLGRTP